MTHGAADARAAQFWARVGRVEPFPRDLESSISWALPLAIVKLPRLTLARARAWLEVRGICTPAATPDRPLRACLVARSGHGFVLMEGSDPADERRMSLGHETAHFLLDCLAPRERALKALGEGVRDVLDGRRPATAEERLAGVLGGVCLGTYTHLIERTGAGDVDRVKVVESEDRADRLALELLAPRREVLLRVTSELPARCAATAAVEVAQAVLIREFGLPRLAARRYGQMLVGGSLKARSFREWLGA